MVNKDFQLTVQTCSEGFAHNTALVLAFSFISKIPMLQKKKQIWLHQLALITISWQKAIIGTPAMWAGLGGCRMRSIVSGLASVAGLA